MNHRFIYFALLSLAACTRPHPAAPERTVAAGSSLSSPSPSVEDAAEGASGLTFSATIVADQGRLARIVAPMDGRVAEMRLEVGDRVVAQGAVAVVRGSVAAELLIALQQARSDYAIAQRELLAQEALLADGIASEREAVEARERLRTAENALAQWETMVESGGLAGSASATIVSPIGGVVLSKTVANNQYVQSGEQLMEVADLSRVWVMADVYESDIHSVRMGQKVEVTALAWPDEVWRGTIDKVYSALDPESKTMKVRIALDNPKGNLMPGMFATVSLVSSL